MSAEARLAVRLTPRAQADAIEGWGQDDAGRSYLKARVRAQPVDGKANAALEALIAQALGLPRSAVALAAGGSGRLKHITIKGLDVTEARRRLANAVVGR